VFVVVIGAPAFSLDRVLVADLVPDPAQRDHAYATLRVATNVGILIGPSLAALLVYLGSWTAFLAGIAALGLVGALVTIVLLPGPRPVVRADQPPGLRHVARDRPFVLLLVAISPLLVVLGQLRRTRAALGIPTVRRLAGASLLMGLPFLVLLVANGVPAIALVILIFISGRWSGCPPRSRSPPSSRRRRRAGRTSALSAR
jgi:dipeptide/tripeptide permease